MGRIWADRWLELGGWEEECQVQEVAIAKKGENVIQALQKQVVCFSHILRNQERKSENLGWKQLCSPLKTENFPVNIERGQGAGALGF